MLHNLRRKRENEEGFTLIELMVVVLIIAILIAIAIPTFLGAQDRARDRAAQSDIRNSLTAAKSIASDFEGNWQSDNDCDATEATDFTSSLNTENASLNYVEQVTSEEDDVSVDISDAACKELVFQMQSSSGTSFCLAANQNGETFKGKDDTGGDWADYAACVTTSATDDW